MSLTREFRSLGSFGRFLEQRAAAIAVGGVAVSAEVGKTLARSVKRGYGKHDLAPLAQATQADRVSKGFTPNDPLLRDGKLLRDSTQWAVGEDFAAVGSPERIAAYHEFGYLNARTGTSVPPRPVYKKAIERAAPAVIAIMERNIGRDLGFSEGALYSDIESKTAIYELDVSDKE